MKAGRNGARGGKRNGTQRPSSEVEARVIKALVAECGMPIMDAIRLVARRVVKLAGE